jgi:hypothetical protein
MCLYVWEHNRFYVFNEGGGGGKPFCLQVMNILYLVDVETLFKFKILLIVSSNSDSAGTHKLN